MMLENTSKARVDHVGTHVVDIRARSRLVPVQVFSPLGEKMCLGNLQDILVIFENKSMVEHG